jgi:uncharacterized coiled-coil DUF342 family protein
MGYYRTTEPVGNTCPLIDRVLEFLNHIEFDDQDDFNGKDIDENIALLEEIRDANSKLRDWGNENAKQADELEEERNDLQKKVKELEEEVEDYKNEIEDLEKQIEELQ